MSKKRRRPDPPWTPFQEGYFSPDDMKLLEKLDEVPDKTFLNSIYQVNVRFIGQGQKLYPAKKGPADYLIHLSIKRRDKRPIHDWRHMQRIKNEIVGPDFEAMEIYPKEDRLVDTSNQYHLWVLPDGVIFPWGYFRRIVSEDQSLGNKQRKLDPQSKEKNGSVHDPGDAVKMIREIGAAIDKASSEE